MALVRLEKTDVPPPRVISDKEMAVWFPLKEAIFLSSEEDNPRKLPCFAIYVAS